MWWGCLLEISICDCVSQTPNVKGADGLVIWWIQSGHSWGPFQQLVGHWVVNAIVTVLYVLVSKRVIRIGGLLVPEMINKMIQNEEKSNRNNYELCTYVWKRKPKSTGTIHFIQFVTFCWLTCRDTPPLSYTLPSPRRSRCEVCFSCNMGWSWPVSATYH